MTEMTSLRGLAALERRAREQLEPEFDDRACACLVGDEPCGSTTSCEHRAKRCTCGGPTIDDDDVGPRCALCGKRPARG
jgi:hypothetical protein